MPQAAGTFEVTMTPQPPDDKGPGSTMGRFLLEKRFAGDLAGTSNGQMLSAMADVKGSAGYVAIERFTGMVQGRSGSFVLQHNGIMSKAGPKLTVVVVPDTGTGELTGLSGNLTIRIENGKHCYGFDYNLAEFSPVNP